LIATPPCGVGIPGGKTTHIGILHEGKVLLGRDLVGTCWATVGPRPDAESPQPCENTVKI